jgi:hypothetical protein
LLGEIQFYKDDEFSQPEKANRLCDLFRVELTDQLIRSGLPIGDSPVSVTISFAVYSDLIRGDVMLSEAQIWVDGKKSRTIRHNTSIADGMEPAVVRLAKWTTRDLVDLVGRKR